MLKREAVMVFHDEEVYPYHTYITSCQTLYTKRGIVGGIDFYKDYVGIYNMTLIPGKPTTKDFLKFAWRQFKYTYLRKQKRPNLTHYCPSC